MSVCPCTCTFLSTMYMYIPIYKYYMYVHVHVVDLVVLSELGEHDDDTTPPVCHHLPEVSTRALHWSLCYDVASLLLVALHTSQINDIDS